MKRYYNRLIVTAVLLLVTLTSSARFNGANVYAPTVYAGLRAGVGGSGYFNLDDPVALATPIGGLALGFKVARIPLYLETGAYYMNMGTKLEERSSRDWDYDYYRGSYRGSYYSDRYRDERRHRHHDTYTVNNHSVMVPLVATYHLYLGENVVLQPFAGFYASYGFDNEKMDFGLRDGVGFSFGHLYVNMGVNIGLVDQDHFTDDYWVNDGQHASLFLGVGVNF